VRAQQQLIQAQRAAGGCQRELGAPPRELTWGPSSILQLLAKAGLGHAHCC
jgi:hypothetical protein